MTAPSPPPSLLSAGELARSVTDEVEKTCQDQRLIYSIGSGKAKEALDASIERALKSYARQAAEEMREAAADKMRHCVMEVLVMWDRPGGPPGNGYRVTTNADRAEAILALPLPPDLGERK